MRNSLINELAQAELAHTTRRLFLRDGVAGLGATWLASMLGNSLLGSSVQASGTAAVRDPMQPLAPQLPPLVAKAKRVIYLHMAGAPSQLELFDYKPELKKLDGQDCPQEFIAGKRFAFIRGVPKLLGPQFEFAQHGESGAWLSDRLPHFAKVVDKACFVRTMVTDQFNHAPAQLLVHTGNQNLGYASMGCWATYGLGSENQNLPGFVVLLSGGKFPDAGKSVWGSGFLPSVYQGVQCRSSGEPVLFLSNPPGIDRTLRGRMVDAIADVNRKTYDEVADPETLTRIAQYELAYRMQMSATDAMDYSQEPAHIHKMYGTQPGQESLANNCLLARRLIERGVRFVQLFDWGWDSHGAGENEALHHGFKDKCRQLDQPVTALLLDLEQRGLLDETLVVWSGEFGRTPMRENRGGKEMTLVGRDHHPHAFTLWMAGGGVRAGHSHGETDPIGYAPIADKVEVRDLQATILRLLGLDHERLVFPFQGLDQKLTGVKPARAIDSIIA
ncbi:DUF1501 domain-containing protein [Lacipirellula sp.]|uniref:DUF1501 domain-containing protein n=1 Tax=Lacipirellula sp. TaxID=2691419 RepID=UPI003D0C8086